MKPSRTLDSGLILSKHIIKRVNIELIRMVVVLLCLAGYPVWGIENVYGFLPATVLLGAVVWYPSGYRNKKGSRQYRNGYREGATAIP